MASFLQHYADMALCEEIQDAEEPLRLFPRVSAHFQEHGFRVEVAATFLAFTPVFAFAGTYLRGAGDHLAEMIHKYFEDKTSEQVGNRHYARALRCENKLPSVYSWKERVSCELYDQAKLRTRKRFFLSEEVRDFELRKERKLRELWDRYLATRVCEYVIV